MFTQCLQPVYKIFACRQRLIHLMREHRGKLTHKVDLLLGLYFFCKLSGFFQSSSSALFSRQESCGRTINELLGAPTMDYKSYDSENDNKKRRPKLSQHPFYRPLSKILIRSNFKRSVQIVYRFKVGRNRPCLPVFLRLHRQQRECHLSSQFRIYFVRGCERVVRIGPRGMQTFDWARFCTDDLEFIHHRDVLKFVFFQPTRSDKTHVA